MIPKTDRRQRDFSGGELDPIAERRSDSDIFQRGVKRARNLRATDTGSAKRRPGRRASYFDGGYHDIVRPTSSVTFDITFEVGRFTARLSGGGVVSNITGCPWTSDLLSILSWQAVAHRIFVCARGMQPQVLTYDIDAGTWSLAAYTPRTDLNGRYLGAMFRYAAPGITLRPLLRTAFTQMIASEAVFDSDMQGDHLLYVNRHFFISAVGGPPSFVFGTPLEDLPPTQRLTIDVPTGGDAAPETGAGGGFRVSDSVEGDESFTTGEVAAIISPTVLDVIVTNQFTGFEVGENIVGPQGRAEITAVDDAPSPGASVQWKEEFMSDYRGWPGSVSLVRQRLCFTDFPQAENRVLFSAIDDPFNLDADTAGDDLAILTYIPASCRVYQVIDGPDPFILTNFGIFYMPVSDATPLTQGNVRFRPITNIAARNVRAVMAGDNMIFAGTEQNRLFACRPTGLTAHPYEVLAINDFHRPLFNNPRALAVSEGSTDAPGRHLYVVNAGDGSLVVGRHNERVDDVGWFRWESTGSIIDVASDRFGEVIVSVAYAGGVEVVESLDESLVMDGVVDLADVEGNDPWQLSTGEPWVLENDATEPWYTEEGALIAFANVTMYGWGDGLYLGPIAIDAEGRVDFPAGYTVRQVGWLYTVEFQPFVPSIDSAEAHGQAHKRRKISRASIAVRDTQTFEADGHVFADYVVGDDTGAARPLRSTSYRWRKLGRSFDPTCEITQTVPGQFQVIEMNVEVTI